MPDALKPGGMGEAGADLGAMPTGFAGSMAEAIEAAFDQLLGLDGMNTFVRQTNSNDARDRRRLLTAIAQGVVRHLVEHPGAIQVSFVDSAGNTVTASVTIKADATLLVAS
jgi:hypothetical protein